ncbi:FtsW/RodA/SpoVE family cell cycle protein [Companilactobacillus insicii]|uniref:FtsW/RodA/SpoVE family cell cycle protein n=1 Tax=Companilactobacillus insicii TaxID=1732567 RepID=UPI000F79F88F|nr:FtsW/RodA/SpoVE family cell cycle protein [Companilactobacillus insicii]
MKKIRKVDLWILIPYLLLLGIGVVMVYSASFYNAMSTGGSSNQYLIKQSIYAILGLFFCFVFFMLKERVLKNKGLLGLVMAILVILPLSALILIGKFHPSSKINGASAWIPIGPFNYQPLEMAKIALILYLALVLTNKESKLLDKQSVGTIWREIQVPIVTVLIVIFLVLFQPDFGGAAILGLITLILVSSSSIPGRFIATLNTSLIVFFSAVVAFIVKVQPASIAKTYQFQRFMAMLHPFKLEQTAGNQLVNSFYAISNGGLFGVGLGNSIQKRGYLPEPHTDFILAIISEELGLMGDLVVLGLLALIVMRIILMGIRTKDTYHSLVYYGVAVMLMAQTVLNVGGLLGLIPLTGVTLPFISYGGSSLLILSAAMGIVMNLEATEIFNKQEQR